MVAVGDEVDLPPFVEQASGGHGPRGDASGAAFVGDQDRSRRAIASIRGSKPTGTAEATVGSKIGKP